MHAVVVIVIVAAYDVVVANIPPIVIDDVVVIVVASYHKRSKVGDRLPLSLAVVDRSWQGHSFSQCLLVLLALLWNQSRTERNLLGKSDREKVVFRCGMEWDGRFGLDE